MLQVKNATPFAAKLLLLPDADGVDTLFTVVKGSFSVAAQLGLAEEQAPVIAADEHHGDPATSSVRVPSDVCLGKPGTDVLMIGSAWAPGGRPTWQMDVSLTVGPVVKRARVSADRVWEAGPGGASIAWLAPFDRMPLVWERAFGGVDQTDKGPTADTRNPVGTGFRVGGGAKPIAGTALPNIEDPDALVVSPKDAPPPACFGPIAPHWEPRKSFAGTYDDVWQRTRAPYLPADFDARFFQLAPPGLVTPGHLRGGEIVDIRGATPEGSLRFQLPAADVRATYRFASSVETRPAALDTIIIEPDARRVVLVWRAALRCDKKALTVKDVSVSVSSTA
jgi:hypothetical protein